MFDITTKFPFARIIIIKFNYNKINLYLKIYISDLWCANIYLGSDNKRIVTTGLGYGDLTGDHDGVVSKIVVQNACSLKVFENPTKDNLLETLIKYDINRPWMNPNNDKLSSYICECAGISYDIKVVFPKISRKKNIIG